MDCSSSNLQIKHLSGFSERRRFEEKTKNRQKTKNRHPFFFPILTSATPKKTSTHSSSWISPLLINSSFQNLCFRMNFSQRNLIRVQGRKPAKNNATLEIGKMGRRTDMGSCSTMKTLLWHCRQRIFVAPGLMIRGTERAKEDGECDFERAEKRFLSFDFAFSHFEFRISPSNVFLSSVYRQNGNTYIGTYQENKRHGSGKFIFANGSVFIGSFRNNKFAHGIYTWNNGRIYDGDWDNTYRHGYGKYIWPDNRKYEGEWKSDKRHGHGNLKPCKLVAEIYPHFGLFAKNDRKIYLGRWRRIRRGI